MCFTFFCKEKQLTRNILQQNDDQMKTVNMQYLKLLQKLTSLVYKMQLFRTIITTTQDETVLKHCKPPDTNYSYKINLIYSNIV